MRRAAILEGSTLTLGRPILLPLALAFLMPAPTRSAIKLRFRFGDSAKHRENHLPSGRAGVYLLR